MERWLKATEAVAKAEETQLLNKRRKKVVKTLLPPKFIEMVRARSWLTLHARSATCMSAEMLSSRPASFRRQYAMRKYIDGKWGDSLQQGALVDQYDLLGYAEDEDELTDDDVVKMGSLAIR